MAQIHPFLMFEGRAEEAMKFYGALFPGSDVIEIARHGPDGPGPEGTVKLARLRIGGETVLFSDSPVKHGFTFTPALSLFVDCATEDEVRRTASALPEGGSVLMPLDNYGFSRQFAWVQDRFGVSWQLMLA